MMHVHQRVGSVWLLEDLDREPRTVGLNFGRVDVALVDIADEAVDSHGRFEEQMMLPGD